MAFWDIFGFGRRKLSLKDPIGWGAGSTTRSAVAVNALVAMQVTAMLCAGRVIAEGISQIPLKLYTETNDEKTGKVLRTPAREHPLYNILAYQPSWLTSFEWREVATLHATLEGNAYGWINRRGDGTVREILPLAPDEVSFRLTDKWEPVYTRGGREFKRNEIFHLRGPGFDGKIGAPVVQLAKEAIGLSKALENSHADLFGKSSRPSGILNTPLGIAPEKAEEIRAAWLKRFGPGGDGGVAVLDGSWDFKTITMSAVDAQFIETRKFQIEEIARAMRVFPQMLMHSDKTSTFASASEFFRAHVIHTLGPWIARWEEALKRDVIGFDGDNANIWPRFSTEGLLRGDPKERAEFHKQMILNGIMSPNEVRAIENLNPREGGDEYLTPLNMRVGDEEPSPKETPDGA